MNTRLLIALLSALPLGSLSAQAHPLAGTWAVTMPAGMRIENGEATPIIGNGTLVLRVEGDSLVGTLQMEPPEGLPARPAARLAGRRASGPVELVQRSEAKVNANGVESTHAVTSTYTLEARGDALEGTVRREMEGMDSPLASPHAVSGKRVAAR